MATVLIVDDDPENRTLLKGILENLNYGTLDACDGRSGTTLYRENLPDVVLLDMLMPDKDGIETLFDLRNINRNARIVMMTSGGRITTDLYKQIVHLLGIPHLLVKPFDPDTVASAIEAALNHRRPDAEQMRGESREVTALFAGRLGRKPGP